MIKKGVATGDEVQEIFKHAKENGYALPAINVVNTSTSQCSFRRIKRY